MRSPHAVLPAGVQIPRIRHAPRTVRANYWEDVAELSAAYGLVLDPWQENVLEGSLGELANGMWASKQIGVSCPRQNGKGAIIEARTLAGLMLFNEQVIVHSAHEARTAQMGFQRLKSYFENYDDLRRKVANIGNAVAREYIRLRSGQEIKFVTRSKSAIRGFSADCLLGTPPLSTDDGIVFDRFRTRGLEGKDHRSGWFEWSADENAELDDVEQWAKANPALGGRISWDNVIAERAVASDEGFARERLGIWDGGTAARVISADRWHACADTKLRDVGGEVAVAIDVSPDRSAATIASAAWTTSGVPYVDVVETRRGEPDWGIEKFVQICAHHDVRAVVIDGRSAAASLVDPLRQQGVTVTVTQSAQMGKACGGFYDAVMDNQVKHLDQPSLNVALSVGRRRNIGDGGWGWSRRDSDADITPVVAATLALWGLTSSEIDEQPRIRTGKAVFV
jgi:phage terminase large subunit-like protein